MDERESRWGARLVVGLLLVAIGGPACSRGAPADHAASAGTDDLEPTAQNERTWQAVEVIDAFELELAIDSDGAVAIVRPVDSWIRAEGTRSESVRIEAEVLSVVHGQPGEAVTMWRGTHGGDTLLKIGRYYAVALRTEPSVSPAFALAGFVEVPEDSIDVAVERHSRAVARLTDPDRG